VPLWVLHRHMGMGGDQLVAAVAGDEAESRHGDSLRAAEGELYMGMIDEIQPLPSARALLDELRRAGHPFVLASSAKPEEVDHYLGLLDARDLVEGWTTSADVEATKPEPDVIEAARAKLPQDGPVVVIGDSTWDCVAAARAGLPTIGLLTGGYGEQELREAGAATVYETLDELIRHLGDPPLLT
jgi:HAD superfamily hydrolase (TIGR01509 family)